MYLVAHNFVKLTILHHLIDKDRKQTNLQSCDHRDNNTFDIEVDLMSMREVLSLRKFYGWYGDLIEQNEVPLSRMLHDLLEHDHMQDF